jgi:hypothetical protein
MYLYFSNLPWQEFKYLNEMKEKKQKLLDDENVPSAFKDILMYVRRLNFDEEPDYNKLTNFCSLF